MTNCKTVSETLSSIKSFEELKGFMEQCDLNPASNKSPTETERQRMASLAAEFELKERKK